MQQIAGFCLPSDEQHLGAYLSSRESYQPTQRVRSLEFVASRRRAIDVGAHVGLWSRPLVEQFDHVVAFEPMGEFRKLLRQNVTSERLTVVPVALGNHSGSVAMEYPAGRTGECHVAETNGGELPICRLDDFDFGPIDYIKIDTEGFELDVLRGAEQTLRQWQPVVTIEQKPHSARYGYGRYDAVRYLESLGAAVLDRVIDDFVIGWPNAPVPVAAVEPKPIAERLVPAMQRLLAGDCEGAEIDYRTILRDDPSNAAVWHLLALACFQQQHADAALESVARAIQADPTHAEAMITHAVFLKSLSRFDEAAVSLQQALRIDPTSAQAHIQLAAIHALRGQREQAEAAYQKAAQFETDPAKLDANNLRVDIECESLVRAPRLCRYGSPRSSSTMAEFHPALGPVNK